MPQHYIIGFQVGPYRMHGYAIRPDGVGCMDVVEYMTDKAEQEAKEMGTIFMPIALVTGPLSPDAIVKVQALVRAVDPEIAKLVDEAEDWHVTVWTTGAEHPSHEPIWEMH